MVRKIDGSGGGRASMSWDITGMKRRLLDVRDLCLVPYRGLVSTILANPFRTVIRRTNTFLCQGCISFQQVWYESHTSTASTKVSTALA